jgi:hypothetical protein
LVLQLAIDCYKYIKFVLRECEQRGPSLLLRQPVSVTDLAVCPLKAALTPT